MREGIEFNPLPAEPDKHQTPEQKRQQQGLEQPGWHEVDVDSDQENQTA